MTKVLSPEDQSLWASFETQEKECDDKSFQILAARRAFISRVSQQYLKQGKWRLSFDSDGDHVLTPVDNEASRTLASMTKTVLDLGWYDLFGIYNGESSIFGSIHGNYFCVKVSFSNPPDEKTLSSEFKELEIDVDFSQILKETLKEEIAELELKLSQGKERLTELNRLLENTHETPSYLSRRERSSLS